MSGRVEGKVAIVTGAGVGIGRATCIRLAEEGARVVVTTRTQAHLDEAAEAVAAACGREPVARVLDVVDDEAIERLVDEVARSEGRIDVVCNNAGIDLPAAPGIEDVEDDDWERLFEVNVTGVFRMCRAVLPHMPAGGSIVNVGSINSFVAFPNAVPYTATKGAVLMLTRALAVEVAPRNIRVNCVCPGIIDTPLTRSFLEIADDPEALEAEYAAAAPLGRMGTAREVADCALFLASDESSFVTGAALLVDGGTTAAG
jgi:NAD(P)-dependent dehydrogenase (short-subunit alcohol dehydrogenase family)